MLDQTLTEFLELGLAIHIGTRNERMEPNGCRVTAVRVEDQGTHLIAYLPKSATAAVLQDLNNNGQAAISVARPADDRAVQIKGAFVSMRDGYFDVWIMNADGSNPENLTRHPAGDGQPAWSPDSRSIVFVSDRRGTFDVFVMRVDGTALANLTPHPGEEMFPAWRP